MRTKSCRPARALRHGLCLIAAALGSLPWSTATPADTVPPTRSRVVWQFDRTTGESTAARPDGSTSQRFRTSGSDWNPCVFLPEGTLKGGQDYTAIATCEIIQPPKVPATFYMFARSKKLGQTADLWQKWTGEKGARMTVRLPMTLRAANDWTFTLGIEGPGELVLDDLRIVEGAGRVVVPAVVGAKPVAGPLPTGMRLPTGAEPFPITPPAPPPGAATLSAVDFGLRSVSSSGESESVAAQNYVSLTAAIAECKKRGAARLVVPPGIYRFASDEQIRLDGLQDFTLDGSGSEFIFTRLHPNRPAVQISNCRRVRVENLTVDWDWDVAPIAHLARVTALSPDGKTIDLTFPDDTATEVARARTMPWLEFWPMEPVTFRPVAGPKIWIPRQSHIEPLGEKSLRISTGQALPLTIGGTYAIRHFDYQMNAFNLTSNHGLLLDGVTIYSMPGMGWVSNGDQDHWGLRRCRIVPRPGTRRPMTTAADGFHSYESQGYLSLEECEISHCGDDCVNIHDNCGSGVTRVDDHTLFAPDTSNWRARFQNGDFIELCGPDYAPLGFAAKLTDVKRDGKAATLTFAGTLPTQVPGGAILWNHHYETHNVRIERCNFHDSGGRGILLAAHGASIEGCTFDHLFAGAFQFHTEIAPGWNEGHGASNVIFRDNKIRTVNARETFGGAALYATAVFPSGPGAFPLFHDLLIEDNQFEDCFGPAMQFSACRNVVVRGNTIVTRTALPNATPLRSAVTVERASQMALGGNTWTNISPVLRPAVIYDPATTSAVEAQKNAQVGEVSQPR